MSVQKLQTIQALRAFAAVSVFFVHVPVVSLGNFGVDVFFVISGFIIAMVSGHERGSFLIKRIARVVPIYWLFTILVFVGASLFPGEMNHTVPNWGWLIKSLFFIPFYKSPGLIHPVLFVGWTLNYEMFFYCIFAGAMWLAPNWPKLCTSLILLGLIAAGIIFHPVDAPLRFWTSSQILEFCFGLTVYWAWHRGEWLFRSVPWPIALSWACIALIALYNASLRGAILETSVAATALLAGALALEGRFRVPSSILMIGDASYSFYLLHPFLVLPVFNHLPNFGAAPWLAIMPTLLACIGLAILSYRFVEMPSNRGLLQLFRRPPRPKPITS